MKKSQTIQLPESDRRFLYELVKVVYSNPFAAVPENLRSTFGVSANTPGDAHYFNQITPLLTQRLTALEALGVVKFTDVSVNDQRVLKSAFLFEIFHHFTVRLDALIEEQQAAGEKRVPVAFAEEILQHFHRRGFTAPSSYHYLALFYQIRRAYRFIVDGLIGQSPSMRQLRFNLWNNLFTQDAELFMHDLWNSMEDFSTLLLGATGTGKGAAAAAIGRSGHIPFDPKAGVFVNSFASTFSAINLSQFPENLIESELFGHRKGAFTGAIDQHKGVFERCLSHGTLFLDEIGDVSLPVQTKLLNVLQERHYTPVGSHVVKRFSGRVVAATNHSIQQLRTEGRFREDFYYRLSADVIYMPTLQQRLEEYPGEMELLVTDLIGKMVASNPQPIVDRVMTSLQTQLQQRYTWPGNVRELSQAIRRIILTGRYPSVSSELGGEAVCTQSHPLYPSWIEDLNQGLLTTDELLKHYFTLLYQQELSYGGVAERVNVDWRTVKRYLEGE